MALFTLFQPKKSAPAPLSPEASALKILITNPSHSKNDDMFAISNETHLEVVNACTKSVQDKLSKLQSIDTKAAIGFAVGTSALLFSFITFSYPIGLSGFAYGAYQLGLRAHAHQEYQQALEDLVRCCDWAANNGDQTTDGVMNNESIVAMLKELAPLMTKEQIMPILANQHEEKLFKKMAELVPNFENQKDNLQYKMYGYGQGASMKELAMAVASYMTQAVTKLFNDYVTPIFTSSSPA